MLRASAFAAALVVAGCAATLNSRLSRFLGSDISAAIEKKGTPTKTTELPDGKKEFTWIQQSPGHQCWITLTTDEQGKIQSYWYQECPNVGSPSGSGHL